MAEHYYKLYNQKISSTVVLPDCQTTAAGKADMHIVTGTIEGKYTEADNPSGLYFHSENLYVFKLPDNTLVQVAEGVEITIEPPKDKEIDLPTLQMYLLGPVLNAALHQRDIVLIHASVLSKNGACIGIAAYSGTGKSTTAGELYLNHRFSVISDDICAVLPGENKQCTILPSHGNLKLLPDAVEALDINHQNLKKLPAESNKLALLAAQGSGQPIDHLDALFILETNQNKILEMSELKGIEKVQAILQNSYWANYLQWMGGRNKQFEVCSWLAQQTKVFRLCFDKQHHPPRVIGKMIASTLSG